MHKDRQLAINYDNIAGDYDRRYHKNASQGVLEALGSILSDFKPDMVLEVGCGTSHWLKSINSYDAQYLIGLDKSLKMLKGGLQHDRLVLCQGEAENLPYPQRSFDFVFCVNALHHFSYPEKFIVETYRILEKQGTIAIFGMDPSDARNRWYIYDFFKGTRERDLFRFPNWSQVTDWILWAGFEPYWLSDIDLIHDPKSNGTVMEDPFLKKNACSQLALLSGKEYRTGIQKIRQNIHRTKNQGFSYPNDIVISMLLALKS